MFVIIGFGQIVEASNDTNDKQLLVDVLPVKFINGIHPGAEVYSEDLLKKIDQMRLQRGEAYSPRTRHLTTDGKAVFTNRLFLESSPYLLQHAHNPVNWYSWGEEAFAAAARLKRPIFLSIGYSTCHWCHVMEEESFEDVEIAKYINEHFIAIKVDREERPDIDAIYMAALHALGKNGGWPMNVWLTPDRKPFFGGTYYPPRDGDRGASKGFLSLLKMLSQAYQSQPEKIAEASQQLADTIKRNLHPVGASTLPPVNNLALAATFYKNNADAFYGGIDGAPKFPSSMPIQFMLRQYHRSGDKKVLEIINLTLTKMAAGGMYDQVGGGFHRYSTDNEWLVPHFEKMLYDNALLVVDYLEAYQVTQDKNFKRIVDETLRYIKRDMTSPEGGFYSATDADSLTPAGHREEGYFFTWSSAELVTVLGKKDAKIISDYYAVSEKGNFEGRNILNTPVSINDVAKKYDLNENALISLIEKSNLLLYEARKSRLSPIRDEKILAAWNGLMISAYAKAGLILQNPDYVQRAIKATKFILNNHYIDGRLFRSFKDKMVKHNAYLNDYAFLIGGLLDLYEVTNDIQWIKQAIELDSVLALHYEDKKNGGFFMTSDDHEKLLAREKPAYDGAEPAGNSVQILNLLRLGEFTSKSAYMMRAINALKSFSTRIIRNPTSLSKMLLAVDFFYDNAKEIVIVTTENNKQGAVPFLDEFVHHFIPNRIISVMSEGEDLNKQSKIITIAEGKVAIKGKATAYVCTMGACELPTSNLKEFVRQLIKK